MQKGTKGQVADINFCATARSFKTVSYITQQWDY